MPDRFLMGIVGLSLQPRLQPAVNGLLNRSGTGPVIGQQFGLDAADLRVLGGEYLGNLQVGGFSVGASLRKICRIAKQSMPELPTVSRKDGHQTSLL